MARKIIRPRSAAPEAPPVAPAAEAPQKLVKVSPKDVKAAKAARAAKPTLNRSAFIRSQPATMTAAEVVARGKTAGLSFRTNLVYEVRRTANRKAGIGPTGSNAQKGPGRHPKAHALGNVHGGHGPPRRPMASTVSRASSVTSSGSSSISVSGERGPFSKRFADSRSSPRAFRALAGDDHRPSGV